MTQRDLRQTREWSNYLSSLGWQTEKIGGSLAYIKKLGFAGSLIKISRSQKLPTSTQLATLQKKYKPLQIIFEPEFGFNKFSELVKMGFVKNKWPLSPSKTIFIELKQSEKILLSKMHQKTRYNISLATRKRLQVNISNDLGAFTKLWLSNMRSKGNLLVGTKEIEACWQAFGQKAKLIHIYKDSQLLAGVLLIIDQDISHYMFAASSKAGNKLFAPTFAAWETLRLAKKNGAKIFDFEGVYDPRYNKATKNWKGFSRFKSGFGGEEIEFAGTYTKYYFPLLKIASKII